MESTLSQFRFGQLQDLIVLFDELSSAGFTINDVREYILSKAPSVHRMEIRRHNLEIKCQMCGHKMYFSAVNVSPGTVTGDDSTFVWICLSCKHEVWTNESLKEIAARIKAGKIETLGI